MGELLYRMGIGLYWGLLRLLAPFHRKAGLMIAGRKDLLEKIEATFEGETSPVMWIHCSSLGEFEQGRPLIEAWRSHFPKDKILLTFFSPSGYEVRKDYALADWVFYVPADTPAAARRFVQAVRPRVVLFVKYEFWYYLLREAAAQGAHLYSTSSIFRPSQPFFRWYGSFGRKTLRLFSWLFVQNDESARLLASIGLSNATVAGDTRFDRVLQMAELHGGDAVTAELGAGRTLVAAGSIWPEDMAVIGPALNRLPGSVALLLAPHEISESWLQSIEQQLSQRRIVRYSAAVRQGIGQADTLLIDNVGLLAGLYRYSQVAYLGGSFGAGVHNVLEPAVHGQPVIFGHKNYKKFKEAVDLYELGGGFVVSDEATFEEKLRQCIFAEDFRAAAGQKAAGYVAKHRGATMRIIAVIQAQVLHSS